MQGTSTSGWGSRKPRQKHFRLEATEDSERIFSLILDVISNLFEERWDEKRTNNSDSKLTLSEAICD